MPCTDGTPTKLDEAQRKIDTYARYLCDILTVIDANYPDVFQKMPLHIQGWWVQHKTQDAKRKAEEAKQESDRKLLDELEEDPAVKAYLAIKRRRRF